MDVRNKEKLFAHIQATSFVLDELRLFLDTHPRDQEALEHWRRTEKIRNDAVKEYTKCYGPINMYDVDVKDRWTWAEGPWPWEGRC